MLAETTRVRGVVRTAEEAGTVRLKIRPQENAKKRLEQTGKVRVRANVTYTPDGGDLNLRTKAFRLVKR